MGRRLVGPKWASGTSPDPPRCTPWAAWRAWPGILILGPRIGKYRPDGTPNAIPGHNMTSATLGCLILWLGWFGFNPGSTMAADAGAISHI
jgi:Amt family ammonium transporter